MSIRFGRSGNGYDSSQVMETADDDWRQITDVSERRKIQNRLAQRNYRRKLRQRLEELERQAGEPPSSMTVKPKKKAKTATGIAKPGVSSAKVTKRKRTNSTRAEREGSVETIPRVPESSDPTSATTISDASPVTPGSHYSLPHQPDPSVRAFYRSDFGPLLVPRAPVHDSPATSWDQAHSPPPSLHQQENPLPSQALVLQPQTPSRRSSLAAETANFTSVYHAESYLATAGAPHPQLPSSYTADPTINPNPLHVNSPLPRDQFYMTVSHSKFPSAMMQNSKVVFGLEPELLLQEDTESNISAVTPYSIPEDLRPTEKQLGIPHHPWVDAIPFTGLRDKLLDYSLEGARTRDYADEDRICVSMCEDCSGWGSTSWDSKSFEMGEDFARHFWFLFDPDMLRSTNFWRLNRGLKPLDLKKFAREADEESKKAWARFVFINKKYASEKEWKREGGKVVGEVE